MSQDRAIPGLRSGSRNKVARHRELGFDNAAKVAPLPEYKPLFDAHLKHLWLNPRVRKGLQSAGFIDEQGNVIDVDAHRRKLYVIEQELAQADCVERDRAMEKDRRIRERQILDKRQEVFERQVRTISQVREERSRKAELSRMMRGHGASSTSSSMRSPHTGSLPAIGTQSSGFSGS
eukprot:TRINITY_DN49818_c0_g1_i1.p1 TRINITY_DN49818_c0_g1~~TRINITY_DN49818_c0_g1_i1.p1  ORF type:complete len:177 (-),score=22.92 TRINITY_DN49818_c0_g1_i1:185-715(-)